MVMTRFGTEVGTGPPVFLICTAGEHVRSGI